MPNCSLKLANKDTVPYVTNSMVKVLLEQLITIQLVRKFLLFVQNRKLNYRVHNSPP
jgi:hypothetical protein